MFSLTEEIALGEKTLSPHYPLPTGLLYVWCLELPQPSFNYAEKAKGNSEFPAVNQLWNCLRGKKKKKKSCSVMSSSLQLHGLQPSRLLCPQNSPGNNTGVGSHSHLPDPGTERMSPALQADSLLSEPPGKPPKTLFYLRHLNALLLKLLASVSISLITQQ